MPSISCKPYQNHNITQMYDKKSEKESGKSLINYLPSRRESLSQVSKFIAQEGTELPPMFLKL